MLEAIRIAKFKAALDAAYNQPTYLFFAPHLSSTYLIPTIDYEVLQILNEKEENIKNALNQISSHNGFWSWIPQGIQDLFFINRRQNPSAQQAPVTVNPFNSQRHDDPNNYKEIPDNIMLAILKNYDYKQKTNPQQAANLLFQQCFLTQQNPINYVTNLENHLNITATSYIYDWFFTIDGICTEVIRQKNQNHITPLQAHADFIAIRKALQTALFIANKNSVFYLGYILPTVITQYLNSIVQQLMIYDAKLSLLCKDPRYGATEEDRYKDILWTRISYAAAGLAATAIIATDYKYGLGTSANWLFNGLFNTGKKALGYTSTASTPGSDNQKKEDPLLKNLTPQEKLNHAQEQLSKAQKAERKIYEDAIIEQKKELEVIILQKINQEKKLEETDRNLQKIVEEQPASLKKRDSQNTDSASPFIIDQQKVQKAQKASENKLAALKKEAFASPKTQAALERKIKETEFELANYENILYTIKEKQNLEISLRKTEQLIGQENNKLKKAQQEYSRRKGWFGRWNGSEIDLKNMSEKQQEEYVQSLNQGFINPLEEIISSDENKEPLSLFQQFQQVITSKKDGVEDKNNSEITNNYYQKFQQALDVGTQQVNNYVTKKQKSNDQYYAGLTTEEKKSNAIWDAITTSDYSVDPNSKTYEYNQQDSRNFMTGLTPEENSEFTPYAAGALVVGATPLAVGAIAGSINGITATAQQGMTEGFANYARTTALGEKIATQTPRIIPTANIAQKTVVQNPLTAGYSGKQIATGVGLAGAGIIGTGVAAQQIFNKPSEPLYSSSPSDQTHEESLYPPISSQFPPIGPNHYGA